MKIVVPLFLIVLSLLSPDCGFAAELSGDPTKARVQVEAAAAIVPLAPTLNQRLPSKAEIAAFRKTQTKAALHAADLAREFTQRFPTHVFAHSARTNRHHWLEFAIRRGAVERTADIRQLENEMMFQPGVTDAQRYATRRRSIDREIAVAQAQGKDMMAAFERGIRDLQKEFPKHPETYQMLYALALRSPAMKAAQIAKEIQEGNAPPGVKQAAQEILLKAQRIGKPLRIKFKSVGGRDIDTLKLKGKVILLDFWASWSAPSMTQLAELQKLYRSHHAKGLEILGINFDQDRNALASLVNYKRIPWPQHHDQGSKLKSLREILGVKQIPALWIVDKHGNLRDTNARQNLVTLVEQLLAEQDK
ncbi:MAG: TlpA family protein disulfide reductase [Limisphaerales bacterium]